MAKKLPWYEDETFWQTMAPIFFSKSRWEKAGEEIDHALRLLKVTPDSAVLDLCCGPGRHSLELARRGFSITGVDRTRLYLDEAIKRAKGEGLSIEFIQGDMRKFFRSNSFDAIINLFTSFGYFVNPADDRKVLKNIFGSLKDGGHLLMELMGKEVLARIFREHTWQEEEGIFVLEEHNIEDNWSKMTNRWVVFKGRERVEFNFSHRLYSATELGALLHASGFTSVEFYGSLAGTLYDHTATRLVALAKKL